MSASLVAVLGVGLVDPAAPILRADDLGATRGDGCFEGCRIRTDQDGASTVDKLDAHLARMARSAAGLGLPFDARAWRELVELACRSWTTTPGEAALKLVLTRGVDDQATGYLTVTPISEDYARLRRDGLRIVTLSRGLTSDAFTDAPWLLGGIKSLSYAVNMAALREVERRGVDDALFLSTDGRVLESPTGSVIWASGRTLTTTPAEGTGILGGTTQARLFEQAAGAGWTVGTQLIGLDQLHAAEAVWLTSSVRGPVEVVEIDGRPRARRPELDVEIRRLSGF
ncbi:aminotransferase class IV [Jatrophihabitans sp.]|uniref:aminotransferase class IV n=1 Tax=Jatrophihabitans sp. TaxID=1932789 RepID=UPI0030C7490F|nr:aminotransferase, class [Jatrophihabitans sp.]